MRIGIITMHKVCNYGSVLQAFALQKVVENLGHDCELIDYIYPNSFQYSRGVTRPPSILRRLVRRIKGHDTGEAKKKKLAFFCENNFKMSKRYKDFVSIHKDPPKYDLFITGSDQVWNPRFTKGDTTFLLDFAPVGSKKISYASSFSTNKIDEPFRSIYTGLLSKYSSISVREQSGVKVVADLLNRNVPICVDPTLLFSREQWSAVAAQKKDKYVGRKYILAYLLKYAYDPSDTFNKTLAKLQDETGFEIIALGSLRSFSGERVTCIYDADPVEFLQLFKNASFVVTSSFHGTAFSLNFGIPLYAVVDGAKSDDRISTLVTSLGVSNCLVSNFDDVCNNKSAYDFGSEQEALNSLRQESLVYLKESISK